MAKFQRREGPYRHSWVPWVCSGAWLITLLVLVITWAAQGKPHYSSEDGNIPYISDIGADVLKPFFIVGCVITAFFLVFTLLAERWLRHRGYLTHDVKVRQKVLAILAIIGSIIGGLGLILLSIFDTKRHPNLHRVFLGVFMLGVALSAIFTIAEYFSLSKHNRYNTPLRYSAMAKAVVAGILIILSIALGICLGTGLNDTGAVLEWLVAFGFIFYPLTFWLDLRKARAEGFVPPPQDNVGMTQAPRNTWESEATTAA